MAPSTPTPSSDGDGDSTPTKQSPSNSSPSGNASSSPSGGGNDKGSPSSGGGNASSSPSSGNGSNSSSGGNGSSSGGNNSGGGGNSSGSSSGDNSSGSSSGGNSSDGSFGKDNKDNKNNSGSSPSGGNNSSSSSDDSTPSSPPPAKSPPAKSPPANSPPSKSPPSSNKSPPPPLHTANNLGNSTTRSHPPPHIVAAAGAPPKPLMSNQDMIITGCVLGSILLIIILVVACIVIRKKKKRKQERQEMTYFNDNQTGQGGSEYYNSSTRNCQHNQDHAVKMPPTAPPSQYSSGQWSGAAPPPRPPGLNSTEMFNSGQVGTPIPPPHPALALGFNKSTFSYEDLAAATDNFAKENLLGQGGFGYVHKGVLPNGKIVAVKSLKAGSGQGEREFQAEVDIISRVHHKHLVSLVGYCIADVQRMLVYEFVPNFSVEDHLYGKKMAVLDFPARLRIALGAAKGFAYLHEDCHPRIIHRDIKAANILLDESFEAKVADFGLAKLSNDTQTHVSTRIMGTFGYLAPEYAASGKLTEKSDVYSYGIVLLELITGKRPVDLSGDEDNLVDWAEPILKGAIEGESFVELVDPKLKGDYNHEEMLRMVACACACVRHSYKKRPKMSQVVRALEGDANLEELNRAQSATFGSSGGSEDSFRVRRKHKNNSLASSGDFTSGEQTGEFVKHSSPSPSRKEPVAPRPDALNQRQESLAQGQHSLKRHDSVSHRRHP